MAETKYETVVLPNLKLIERWKRNGASEEEIAKRLGIGYSTFNLYKSKKLELLEALKKGQEVVDTEVENALLRRALGYSYDEVTQERTDDGMKITKVVTKQVVPDVTAQIYWLKNRCPDKWRDKLQVETSVSNENKELMREYLNSVKNGNETK